MWTSKRTAIECTIKILIWNLFPGIPDSNNLTSLIFLIYLQQKIKYVDEILWSFFYRKDPLGKIHVCTFTNVQDILFLTCVLV